MNEEKKTEDVQKSAHIPHTDVGEVKLEREREREKREKERARGEEREGKRAIEKAVCWCV